MHFNLPTWLTLVRIMLIPVIVSVFYLPWQFAHFACAVVFGIAGITDWLDGYLARKMCQTTLFGAFLDPVADKLMVAAALIVLVDLDRASVDVALIIIGREIAISALREWMAELGQRTKVAVSSIGKYKTILQMVGLSMMLYRNPLLGLPVYDLGVALTILAAILTLMSMIMYLRAAWPTLKAAD